MPVGYTGDPNIPKYLERQVALAEASLKWYWRLIAIIVVLATVTSAVFQCLSYFCR